MKYVVVESTSGEFEAFIKTINDLIVSGYEPLGGVAATKDNLYQALIKK